MEINTKLVVNLLAYSGDSINATIAIVNQVWSRKTFCKRQYRAEI